MPKPHSVAGSIMRENPTLFAGLITFTCMFALVAGNALVSQPGQHPGPIWKTRDDVTTNSVYSPYDNQYDQSQVNQVPAVETPARRFADLSKLTRIAVPQPRPSDQVAASEMQQRAPAEPNVENSVQNTLVSKSDDPAQQRILSQTQDRLAKLGLYKGKVDGLYGPATKSAIETYQVNAGLKPTGLPSAALLFKLNQTVGLVLPENEKSEAVQTTARPAAPASNVEQENVPRQSTAETPVQSPVKKATTSPATTPSAVAPSATTAPEARTNVAEQVETTVPAKPAHEPEMVRLVQRGLTVFGVEGISVDGVMGEKTIEAISRFQERYQLPTTGMPDDRTIMKMLEIGALRRS